MLQWRPASVEDHQQGAPWDSIQFKKERLRKANQSYACDTSYNNGAGANTISKCENYKNFDYQLLISFHF